MISLRCTGQTALVSRLKRVRENFSTIVRDVRLDEWMLRRQTTRYDKEVNPDGTPWAPLLDQTIKRKKRAGSNGPTLVRSGKLRKAVDIIVGSRTGLFAIDTGLGFRVGVNDPDAAIYGRVHNQGLYSGQIKRHQKRRRFIGLSPLDVTSAKALLRRRAQIILGG